MGDVTCITHRDRLQYCTALLQVEVDVINARIDMTVYFHQNKKGKKSQVKKMVVWPWLTNDRWLQFGIYDQLIAELSSREDTDLEAFINFKRMPPEMYGDILTRVAP